MPDLSPVGTKCLAVAELICAYVTDHHDYKVVVHEGIATTLIEILGGAHSSGILIGPRGQMADAIRTVLRACATKDWRVRCQVEGIQRAHGPRGG
jgi:predicted RNA-binding protein YlqC (UPF0109 family)